MILKTLITLIAFYALLNLAQVDISFHPLKVKFGAPYLAAAIFLWALSIGCFRLHYESDFEKGYQKALKDVMDRIKNEEPSIDPTEDITDHVPA